MKKYFTSVLVIWFVSELASAEALSERKDIEKSVIKSKLKDSNCAKEKKTESTKITFGEIFSLSKKLATGMFSDDVAEKDISKTEYINQKEQDKYGVYKVVSGDALGFIAKKFNIKTKKILLLNSLGKGSLLRVGKKLKIPLPQKTIDAIVNAEYIVEKGDTPRLIAKKFHIKLNKLLKFNSLKANSKIKKGKKITLPLPYVLRKIELDKRRLAKKKLAKKQLANKKRGKVKMIRSFGKRKLRVTATAYTSHCTQTDKTPFLAAWNNRLRPGMKSIAVSRDLLSRYGLRNGMKIRIGGLRGYYKVRDKMNKRYKKRIDIYMGMDQKRALRWGRRSVEIFW